MSHWMAKAAVGRDILGALSQHRRSQDRFEQLTPPGPMPRRYFSRDPGRPGGLRIRGRRPGPAAYTGDRSRRFTRREGLSNDKVRKSWRIRIAPYDRLQGRLRHYSSHLSRRRPDGAVKVESTITQANGLRSDKTLFLKPDTRGWLWVGRTMASMCSTASAGSTTAGPTD